MALQQDILDTIGETGVEVDALQARVGNIGANELDLAVRALQRAKRIRVVNDRYEVVPTARLLGQLPPLSAEEEAAASLRPAPVRFRSARKGVVNGTAEECPDASRTERSIGRGCESASAGASTQPVISDRVFERVKAQQQAALNRIAVLEVDLSNERARLKECEEFLRLYERFAQGAA